MPTFDVFGRFVIEIHRSENLWIACRVGQGVKIPIHDFVIPAGLPEADLAIYLDDIYHEMARPGQTVQRIAP